MRKDRNKNKEALLTQWYLWTLFDYCDKTGSLFYKIKTSNKVKIGKRAGSPASKKDGSLTGYELVTIGGKSHCLHRLIFFMFRGFWPDLVDHIKDGVNIDGLKSNRISNLQELSDSDNTRKQGIRKGGSSVYRGVHLNKKRNKWIMQCNNHGVVTYGGTFTIEIDAARAYDKKIKELYPDDEFIVLNFPDEV